MRFSLHWRTELWRLRRRLGWQVGLEEEEGEEEGEEEWEREVLTIMGAGEADLQGRGKMVMGVLEGGEVREGEIPLVVGGREMVGCRVGSGDGGKGSRMDEATGEGEEGDTKELRCARLMSRGP